MSELFKHLGPGQFPSSGEYNRLLDAVVGLLRSTGVQYFADSRGVHVRRMPSSSTLIHKAYAKVAAGAGSTIVCFLDVDATGEEITVNIEIVGGSDLNAALPRLEDGTLITVWNDDGTWRNAGNPFQTSGPC